MCILSIFADNRTAASAILLPPDRLFEMTYDKSSGKRRDVASVVGGTPLKVSYGGWAPSAGWTEQQLSENEELLAAAVAAAASTLGGAPSALIAPSMLRPIHPSSGNSGGCGTGNSAGAVGMPSLYKSATNSNGGGTVNKPTHDPDDEDDEHDSDHHLAGHAMGSPPNQVKFVNATVEILQNQIRKEEAPKKKRTRTTPDQLRILQKAFSTDPMPSSSARLSLAKKLGMNARAVQVWFQNRRAKEKLEAKRAESTHCRDQPVVARSASLPSAHKDYMLMGGYLEGRAGSGLSSAAGGGGPLFQGHHPQKGARGFLDGPASGYYSAVSPTMIPAGKSSSSSSSSMPSLKLTASSAAAATGTPFHATPDESGAYDLGMYFGDPSLAQYTASFDLGAYSLMDSLSHAPQNRLMDDFEDSEDASVVDALCQEDAAGHHLHGLAVAEAPFGQQRFQSMPSIGSSYGEGGLFGNNSLGILFDPSVMAEVGGGSGGGSFGGHQQRHLSSTDCSPGSTFAGLGTDLASAESPLGAATTRRNGLGGHHRANMEEGEDDEEEGAEGHGHRSHSIDVLGIMGEAAALEGRIFSTPAAREAFMTAPLGQSIPMPGKPRSLSLPEIMPPGLILGSGGGLRAIPGGRGDASHGSVNGSSRSRSGTGVMNQAHLGAAGSASPTSDVEISTLFRGGGELGAIREEEGGASPPPVDVLSTPVPVKRLSNAGLIPPPPSSALLVEGYHHPGMGDMVAIDDIQAYLDGMSASL